MYDYNDIQKMINDVNSNGLKPEILKHISPMDRDDVSYVLSQGYYEAFERFDSDVCEQFINAYEKVVLDEEYQGDELCCECGHDFGFSYNPIRHSSVTCPHCGRVQMPCSLCDTDIVNCSGDCSMCPSKIREVLVIYREV